MKFLFYAKYCIAKIDAPSYLTNFTASTFFCGDVKKKGELERRGAIYSDFFLFCVPIFFDFWLFLFIDLFALLIDYQFNNIAWRMKSCTKIFKQWDLMTKLLIQ